MKHSVMQMFPISSSELEETFRNQAQCTPALGSGLLHRTRWFIHAGRAGQPQVLRVLRVSSTCSLSADEHKPHSFPHK